ncbi:MAG2-interacting protein 2 [Sesamum alatum]|uniref:MAG2-interacting protein 2 n=1 Tax=Sesamum alatum TaxID=300844 RepID=A0AAE1YLE7_9LAMI|nr:MAG2-interacting protein 2 [Sesamum alatum]
MWWTKQRVLVLGLLAALITRKDWKAQAPDYKWCMNSRRNSLLRLFHLVTLELLLSTPEDWKTNDKWSLKNGGERSMGSYLDLRMEDEIEAEGIKHRLKLAECHVEPGRLVTYYQVPKLISFFLDAHADKKGVNKFFCLLLSKFIGWQPAQTNHDWANMWRDLQSLALATHKAKNLVMQAAPGYFFSAPTLACAEAKITKTEVNWAKYDVSPAFQDHLRFKKFYVKKFKKRKILVFGVEVQPVLNTSFSPVLVPACSGICFLAACFLPLFAVLLVYLSYWQNHFIYCPRIWFFSDCGWLLKLNLYFP